MNSMKVFTVHGYDFLRPVIEAMLQRKSPEHDSLENWEPISTGERSSVARGELRGLHAYFKVYRDPWFRKFQSLLRPSRAHREFLAMSLLQHQVKNPIQALAWGETRRLGAVSASVFVTKAWASASDLRATRNSYEQKRGSVERGRLLCELKRIVKQLSSLHDQGTYLGDGYDKNLLLSQGPGKRSWAWIDQPHLSFYGAALPWNRRREEMARLDKGLSSFLTDAERDELWDEYFPRDMPKNDKESKLKQVRHLSQQLKKPSLHRRLRLHFQDTLQGSTERLSKLLLNFHS